MKRKVKRYNEGELVDSFSEYQGFGQMGPRTIQEDINAEEENRKPQMRESISVSEFEEPGTAGFSRTAMRQPVARPKPVTVPVAKPSLAKPAAVKVAEKPMGRTAMGKTAEMEMEAVKKAPAKKPADGKSLSSYAPDARSGRSTNVSYLRKDRLGMEPDMYIARRRMKEGFKSGGSVGSASKRADGIATKGKTRGRYI